MFGFLICLSNILLAQEYQEISKIIKFWNNDKPTKFNKASVLKEPFKRNIVVAVQYK